MSCPMFCCLCGAETIIHRTADEQHHQGGRPEWLSIVRFVHWDHEVEFSKPEVTGVGRIARRDSPIPYLLNPRTGAYDRLESQLLNFDKHQSTSVSKASSPSSTSRTTDRTPSYEQIASLFSILGSCPFDGHEVGWPHEYSEAGRYRLIFGYREHSPEARERMELEPATPKGIDFSCPDVKDLKAELKAADIFSKLPTELIQRIFLYVDAQDIITLSMLESRFQVAVPDNLWKSFFDLHSELGYLKELMDAVPGSLTWYQRYTIARSFERTYNGRLMNRGRVWRLMARLSDLIKQNVTLSRPSGIDNPVEFPFPTEQEGGGGEENLPLEPFWSEQSESGCIRVQCFQPMRHDSEPNDYYGARVISVGDIQLSELQCPVMKIQDIPRKTIVNIILHETKSGSEVSDLLIASDKFGIKDISVHPESAEPAWAGGGRDLGGTSFTRRKLLVGADGIGFSKFHIGMDATKVTRLWLEGPGIQQKSDLQPVEQIIESAAWMPTIPKLEESLGESMNVDKAYLLPVGSSWLACEPFSTIRIADSAPVRFTCWVHDHTRICGIQIITEEKDSNQGRKTHLLGFARGAAIDFPVNGTLGERIASITALTARRHESIVGLMLTTTFGRCFHLRIFGNNDNRIVDTQVLSERESLVTGIWARVAECPHVVRRATIDSIGCFSIPNPDRLGQQATGLFPAFNARFLETNNRQFGTGRDLMGGRLSHYTSRASLIDLKSITPYIRQRQDMRIIGLALQFGADSDSAYGLCGNPLILGQISDGKALETIFVDENIVFLDVFRAAPRECSGGPRLKATIGLRFQTTSHRKIEIGDCRIRFGSYEDFDASSDWDSGSWTVRKYDMTVNKTLVWDFNEHFDFTFVEGS